MISMKMNDEMSFICLVALLFVMYARKCNFGNSESLLDKKICHPEPPLAKDLRRCFDRESPRQAFQRIVVGKPREADQVPNIPGGPSPKIGAQDDSCLYTSFIPLPQLHPCYSELSMRWAGGLSLRLRAFTFDSIIRTLNSTPCEAMRC
jgi:hypothetical protein